MDRIRITVSVFALLGLSGCASSPSLVEQQLNYAADPSRISAKLQTQRHFFESCRSAYGADHLNGTLTVRFRVQPTGHTSDPHIFETIGQSSALDRCLSEAALNLQFDPMPRGMVAEVEYPMEFRSARTPASARRTR